MKLRSKLFALVGASALVLGIAGTAFAASGSVSWDGNGVTDGTLNTTQCDDANTPYLLFILTPGGTDISAATLTVNGDVYQGDLQGNGSFHFTTDFYDLGSIDATADFTYSGSLGNVQLVISHGCPGETSSSSSETSSSSSSSTSSTTSFTDSVSDTSSSVLVPTEPNTATIGDSSAAGPTSGLWMLLAGLGVVGGSVLVLLPSRAKNKR